MAKNTGGKPLPEKYREFFQPIVDKVRNDPQWSTNKPKASGKSYEDFASGHGGIAYGSGFQPDGNVRAYVYIAKREEEWNKQLFKQLEERKKSIEAKLGKLHWDRLDHAQSCRIETLRDGTIDDDPKTLDDIREWMIERLVAFKEVFGPELDRLLR